MAYMTLIYDYFNVLIRIEERNSKELAERCGKFWTKRDGWYQVIQPNDETERSMYYALLNQ